MWIHRRGDDLLRSRTYQMLSQSNHHGVGAALRTVMIEMTRALVVLITLAIACGSGTPEPIPTPDPLRLAENGLWNANGELRALARERTREGWTDRGTHPVADAGGVVFAARNEGCTPLIRATDNLIPISREAERIATDVARRARQSRAYDLADHAYRWAAAAAKARQMAMRISCLRCRQYC